MPNDRRSFAGSFKELAARISRMISVKE